MFRIWFAGLTCMICIACVGSRLQNHAAQETTPVLLDSLVVVADRATPVDHVSRAHGSEQRSWDLIHTRLDLSFDWQHLTVQGSATLTLIPLFNAMDSLRLNAQYFDIHALSASPAQVKDYTYDGNELVIRLGHSMAALDTLRCHISYVAHPHRAVSRDHQGLFFIDPLDTIPALPRHLWTIGETQYNSQWFPTIDYPNERQTQDFSLTIDSQLVSLSNGQLVSSAPAGNGKRTDRWMMDLPHAPYLAMLAIGDYDVVRDTFSGVPAAYYVDKGYGPSAREIFAHTGEMLSFFSTMLQYPYPWPKYDQVVVHDFTAGAMENTTAVTFSAAVQAHTRDLLVHGTNDDIVAHEMFHHWFGDLVTCESWAQLTLNEGFANYGEYLWADYKYGADAAQGQYLDELQAYLSAAETGIRPLIDFQYRHADDLFDAHSYNKGCLILHHLRHVIGDSAFFRGMRAYLHENAFNAVEVHHLRLAMEESSGMDLNAFFDQWFFSAGHPIVKISDTYDPANGVLTLLLSQKQDSSQSLSAFTFPLTFWLFNEDGHVEERTIEVNQRHQEFQVPIDREPAVICYDPHGTLPWSYEHPQRSLTQCRLMIRHSNPWLVRREALVHLVQYLDELQPEDLQYILSDPHWTIRDYAIGVIPPSPGSTFFGQIRKMAEDDPDIRVRLSALAWVGEEAEIDDTTLFTSLIRPDAKTLEISLGLKCLLQIDSLTAMRYARLLEGDSSAIVLTAVSEVYANWPSLEQAQFFRQAFARASSGHAREFFGFWAAWIFRQDVNDVLPEIEFLNSAALDPVRSLNERYYSMFTLWMLREWSPEHSDFQKFISGLMVEIREQTTNSTLSDLFENFN